MVLSIRTLRLAVFGILMFILNEGFSNIQKSELLIDSLKAALDPERKDTNTIKCLFELGDGYKLISKDSSHYFYQKGLDIALELEDPKFESEALKKKGLLYFGTGDYSIAIECFERALKIYNVLGDKYGSANCINNIGSANLYQGRFEKAIELMTKSLEIRRSINDSSGVSGSYNNIGLIHYNLGNFDEAISNFEKAIKIKEELKDTMGILGAYFNMAMIHQARGEYETAIKYNKQLLDLAEKKHDENTMADCYNNLGTISYELGIYDQAMDYFQRSITYKEKMGDKRDVSLCYSNLGNIQFDQKNYEKALNYYNESLKISIEIGDKLIQGNNYLSIANVWLQQSKFDEAMEYFMKVEKLKEATGDKTGITACYSGIGSIYQEKGNYTKASQYYEKAIAIKREMGDRKGLATMLVNLSVLNFKLNNLGQSLKYSTEALRIGLEIQSIPVQKDAHQSLSNAYAKTGNYKDAWENLLKYTLAKDSLYNESKMKEIEELETKYQTEKKEQQIINQENKIARQNAEFLAQENQLKQEKTIRYSIIIGLLMLIVLVIIVYSSFRQKKKANIILAEQKVEIEEKNEELNQLVEVITDHRDKLELQRDQLQEQKEQIDDSIRYAKRIQTAILPSDQILHEIKNEYFIVFRPKDIVSGDFYWATKTEEWSVVTVADCTGHGVPGAFMSMLGVSFLNEIVRKKPASPSGWDVVNSAEVLNQLRSAIIEALKQNAYVENQIDKNGLIGETSIKDGLDMSIIAIHKSGKKAFWAGANNPLYIIRNKKENDSTATKMLEEFKGDKMPVSVHLKMEPFTNHELELNEGDTLYLFTDGYPDQFGGEKGKKFKYKPFKSLLLEISNESMANQKKILESTLDKWMNINETENSNVDHSGDNASGHYEQHNPNQDQKIISNGTLSNNQYGQVDDITILGLKI